MTDKITKIDLTDTERNAYEKWKAKDLPPLAGSRSAQFFEMFLQGSSCEMIHRVFPNMELGMIVDSRIRYDWDLKKAEYLASLFDTARSRVLQTQMEAVHFMADQLAAVHKLQGDKVKKFLSTGNPDDLGDAGFVMNAKQYKEIVGILKDLLALGKGDTQTQYVVGEIKHVVEEKKQTINAADVVKKLLESKKKPANE